jgi:DNA-binding NtrC family response regulator
MEQKRLTRLGDSREREVDLRIVSATNRVLEDEVKAGRFREDLYFRLRGAQVVLPPLRDRPQELPLLASVFLKEACSRYGRSAPHLSAAVMEVLSTHAWRGNVRELKAAMDYVATMSIGPIVEPSHLPDTLYRAFSSAPELTAAQGSAAVGASSPVSSMPSERRTFRPLAEEVHELERQRILEALEATGGVQTRAAQLIGMPLRTFAFKLKRYKISWRREGAASGEERRS